MIIDRKSVVKGMKSVHLIQDSKLVSGLIRKANCSNDRAKCSSRDSLSNGFFSNPVAPTDREISMNIALGYNITTIKSVHLIQDSKLVSGLIRKANCSNDRAKCSSRDSLSNGFV